MKEAKFLIILILLTLAASAQVKFPDKIEHNDPNLPLIEVDQIKGGVWQVDSVELRDAIPTHKRAPGMIVIYPSGGSYVVSVYTESDITQTTWANSANWEVLGAAEVAGFLKNDGDTMNGDLRVVGNLFIAEGSLSTDGGTISTDGGNLFTQGGNFSTNGGQIQSLGGVINSGGGHVFTENGNVNTGTGTIITQRLTHYPRMAVAVIDSSFTPDTSGAWINLSFDYFAEDLTSTGFELDEGKDTIIAHFEGTVEIKIHMNCSVAGEGAVPVQMYTRAMVDSENEGVTYQMNEAKDGDDMWTISYKGYMSVIEESTINIQYNVSNNVSFNISDPFAGSPVVKVEIKQVSR